VALIVRAQVKTDRKAAVSLAQLHAAGLLVGVWIPPQEIRDLRALIAQRWKMVRLTTTAKNRLHSALHRHHFEKPPGSQPFSPKHREFWLSLPVSPLERANIECDWETLQFAIAQRERIERTIAQIVAPDPRLPLLVQLPGIGFVAAATLLAAIGDIARKLLVAVWHVLTDETADRFADPVQVACALFAQAYKVGVANLPDGQSALQYTRRQLDRLQIGQHVTEIPWGSKRFKLPPSGLGA
jgi:hypothetical protein